jgi:hypothetical protein
VSIGAKKYILQQEKEKSSLLDLQYYNVKSLSFTQYQQFSPGTVRLIKRKRNTARVLSLAFAVRISTCAILRFPTIPVVSNSVASPVYWVQRYGIKLIPVHNLIGAFFEIPQNNAAPAKALASHHWCYKVHCPEMDIGILS